MRGSYSPFFRQTGVLTARYFHIFFNNRRNILMALFIPFLTMVIVALVACKDMYTDRDAKYEELNGGYPLLSWQTEPDLDPVVWDGSYAENPAVYTTVIDDEEYYVISDAADFVSVISQGGKWLEKNYCLGNDIDLDNCDWTPVGTEDTPFCGKFDGNGHIVFNLNISSNIRDIGFFGFVKDAEIKNFGVSGVKLESGEYNDHLYEGNAGAIAGTVLNSEIDMCFARDCSMDFFKEYQGIIAGRLLGDSKIKTCYGILPEASGDIELMTGYLEEKSDLLYSYSVGKTCKVYRENSEREVSPYRLKEFPSEIGEKGEGFRQDKNIADYKALQIGLFMIVCVAIFVGVCNSIQEIIKERVILKREYMSGIRIGPYIISKLIVQGTVCAVQVLLIMLIFMLSVSGRTMPEGGVVFPFSCIDFYITLFLLTFAADVTALFISAVVRSSVMANTFIPIVLIVQIIYSGVLFDLGGAGDILADFMISRWGISALAAISHLNEARPELLLKHPEYESQLGGDLLQIKTAYESSAENMLFIWAILLVFIVVFSVAAGVALINIKKDRR